MTLREFFSQEGYSTVDAGYYERIREWDAWYRGDVGNFHHYKVYNGQHHLKCRRDSLNMAKRVCEDWANLLMNERIQITLGGENGAEREQAFFDEVARENNFWTMANEMQEYKAAYGTVAYLPYADGVTLHPVTGEPMGGGDIRINYVTAENIFPLRWENGIITECAFAGQHFIGARGTTQAKEYLHLQRHVLEDGWYVIYNDLFSVSNGQLERVAMTSVPGFEGMVERIDTHSPEKQFVIDRLAIANNVDKTCPLGVSVFANAIGTLRGIDLIYDSYNNEFILGKKRIMATASALHEESTGAPVFDPYDVVFYALPGGMSDESSIHEIDMKLRAQEHEIALQNRLTLLSEACGFGEKRYRFDSGSVATATQIISENSQLFRTLQKHEKLLEASLKKLVRAVLRIGRDTLRLPVDPDVEITIDFDDSIIEDKQSEFARDWQMLGGGILRPEEFRAKWLHEDVETAFQNLPDMARLNESVMF